MAHGSSQSLFSLVLGLVEGRDGLSLFLFLWVGYLLLGCRILMKTEEGLGFQCNMFIRGNNYLIKLKLFVTIRKYLREGGGRKRGGHWTSCLNSPCLISLRRPLLLHLELGWQ